MAFWLFIVVSGFQGKYIMTCSFYFHENIPIICLDETGFFLLLYFPTILCVKFWTLSTKYTLSFYVISTCHMAVLPTNIVSWIYGSFLMTTHVSQNYSMCIALGKIHTIMFSTVSFLFCFDLVLYMFSYVHGLYCGDGFKNIYIC